MAFWDPKIKSPNFDVFWGKFQKRVRSVLLEEVINITLRKQKDFFINFKSSKRMLLRISDINKHFLGGNLEVKKYPIFSMILKKSFHSISIDSYVGNI